MKNNAPSAPSLVGQGKRYSAASTPTLGKKRSEKEFREASDHLYYEFSMLMSVAQGLASGTSYHRWLMNALLESFVIHFRALLSFFYPPVRPNKDDILSEDYFESSSEWQQIRPALSENLRRAKARADKEVAHLTYARLDVAPEAKGWAFIEIANEMKCLMGLFLQHVPKSRLSSVWERTKF